MHPRFRNHLNQSVYSASLFPEDTLVGLLTIAEPATANAIKDAPNNYPHGLLYEVAPFHAAMSCGSNTIPTPGLSLLHIQAGINRSPIVTTKAHGSLAFNYDLATLGYADVDKPFYSTVEFALVIFLKSFNGGVVSLTGSATGRPGVDTLWTIIKPDTNEKYKCTSVSMSRGSSMTLGRGDRIAMVFSGQQRIGEPRVSSNDDVIGYQNSLYASVDISSLGGDVKIDEDLTSLAMTTTFELDYMLWNR